MVDVRLINYIKEQRRAGYTDDQISQVLLSQGYPKALVAAAIKEASKPTKEEIALLKGYINTYLSQGYAKEQIKQGLVSQGYNPRAVNTAIGTGSNKALFVLPIIAVIVIVVGFLMLHNTNPTSHSPKTNDVVRLSDIIDRLPQTAKRNPEVAVELCNTVVDGDKDRCLMIVGQDSGNPSYCEKIKDDYNRDKCYLSPYIYEGRYEYCDKLTLPTNIDYCDRVKSLSAGAQANA